MKYLSLIVSVALTIFIFSMSAESGVESASMSQTVAFFVQDLIDEIIYPAVFEIEMLELVIRKAAHVCEYFILGISYALTFHLFHLPLWSLIIAGVIIALGDEASQLLAESRGPSFFDAMVYDVPGYLLGILLLKRLAWKPKRKINVS